MKVPFKGGEDGATYMSGETNKMEQLAQRLSGKCVHLRNTKAACVGGGREQERRGKAGVRKVRKGRTR